jgi:hypothetical protein
MQESNRREAARLLREVASLVVLARTLFKRIDRRGSLWDLWDAVNEDLGNSIESLVDLQTEIEAESTGAAGSFALEELLKERA